MIDYDTLLDIIEEYSDHLKNPEDAAMIAEDIHLRLRNTNSTGYRKIKVWIKPAIFNLEKHFFDEPRSKEEMAQFIKRQAEVYITNNRNLQLDKWELLDED